MDLLKIFPVLARELPLLRGPEAESEDKGDRKSDILHLLQ